MLLTVSHCKYCGSFFEGNQERCPTCGKRGPQGRRNLLLKWIAVLIFLVALGVTAYTLTHL
jgi:RNA polymerase subunit RPABC4/transcription elongation factor Spt4